MPSTSKLTSQNLRHMIQMHEQGYSFEAIGKRFGISGPWAGKLIKAHKKAANRERVMTRQAAMGDG